MGLKGLRLTSDTSGWESHSVEFVFSQEEVVGGSMQVWVQGIFSYST